MLTLLDKYTLQNITSFCFDNIISLSSVCKHLHSSLHNSDIANTIKQAIANKHPFYSLLAQQLSEYKLSTNIISLYKAYKCINLNRSTEIQTYCHIVDTKIHTILEVISNKQSTNAHIAQLLQKRYQNDFMWMLLHGDLVYYVNKSDRIYASYIWNAHTSELMLNHNFNYNKDTDIKYNSCSHLSCNTYLPECFKDDMLKVFPINYWQNHNQTDYTNYRNQICNNNLLASITYKLNKIGINSPYIFIDLTCYTEELISTFTTIAYDSPVFTTNCFKNCEYYHTRHFYMSHINLPSNYYMPELYVIWQIHSKYISPDVLLDYSTIKSIIYNSLNTKGYIEDLNIEFHDFNDDYSGKRKFLINSLYNNRTIVIVCN